MICKNCGTENSAESIFCSKCGGRLDTIVNEEAINKVETPVAPVEPVSTPVEPVSTPVEPVVQAEPTVTPAEPVLQPKAVVQPVAPVVNEQPVVTAAPVAPNKPKSNKIGLIIALVAVLLILATVVVLFATGILSIEKSDNNTKDNNVQEVNNGGQGKVEEVKKTFNLGDAVTTVDGSKWHVIGTKGDTVTLLLDELAVEETGYGQSASPEDQVYSNSTVKKYIDETYMPKLTTNIDAAGGDSSKIEGRVITAKEYLDLTKTSFNDNYTSTSYVTEAYENKDQVCKMLDIMSLTKSFWTATNVKELDTTSKFYGVIYIYHESGKFSYFCNKDMEGNFAVVDLATNSDAQLNATFVGIRPVIETPSVNIK